MHCISKPLNATMHSNEYNYFFLSNRDFQLDPHMKSFEFTLVVPETISIGTVEGTVKIFSIDKPGYGFIYTRISVLCYAFNEMNPISSYHSITCFHLLFEIAAENLQIHYTCDCDVIERDGKHYANVRGIRSKIKFEDISFKFEGESAIPIISEMIHRIVNVNAKLLYAEMESTWEIVIGEIAQTILTRILDKMAIQDFFE